jgi:hypothetical protein
MATIRDPKNVRQDDDYNRDRDHDRDRDRDRDRNKDDDPCKEQGTLTEKTIKREKKKICDELKEKVGIVRQWEQSRRGAHYLYNDKKCCFIYTEKNWQYYRNLELMVGVELLQVNEELKNNVTEYKKWNDDLAATLKELVKATKEAKGKFAELKEAACKLNTCINDSCQSTQRKILTGESYDNCKEGEIDKEVLDKCNAKNVLKDLEEIPIVFLHDIDIIFNSAIRVAGIQVFSNVSTLDPLQKVLQEKSKAFDDFIQEKMKKGGDDLKKAQEELTKAVQELTKQTTGLYFRRSDYKGVFMATKKLCYCDCDCIEPCDRDGRLDKCKCKICDICDDVKIGVCKPADNPVCREMYEQQEQSAH